MSRNIDEIYHDHQSPYPQSKEKKPLITPLRLILMMVIICIIILGWFSLRYIPWFTVTEVKIEVEQNISVPSGVNRILNPIKGMNLFEIKPNQLEKTLEAQSVVAQASVTRRIPGTLKVTLTLVSPAVLIASVEETTVQNLYMEQDGSLITLPPEDFQLFAGKLFVVQITPSYASYLERYGIDASFRTVLTLVDELTHVSNEQNNLITMIKYDNNGTDQFGRMVLEIPSCIAQLWVREAVSPERITAAVGIIKQEYDRDMLGFLNTGGARRYDLYADALVKRF